MGLQEGLAHCQHRHVIVYRWHSTWGLARKGADWAGGPVRVLHEPSGAAPGPPPDLSSSELAAESGLGVPVEEPNLGRELEALGGARAVKATFQRMSSYLSPATCRMPVSGGDNPLSF